MLLNDIGEITWLIGINDCSFYEYKNIEKSYLVIGNAVLETDLFVHDDFGFNIEVRVVMTEGR